MAWVALCRIDIGVYIQRFKGAGDLVGASK